MGEGGREGGRGGREGGGGKGEGGMVGREGGRVGREWKEGSGGREGKDNEFVVSLV